MKDTTSKRYSDAYDLLVTAHNNLADAIQGIKKVELLEGDIVYVLALKSLCQEFIDNTADIKKIKIIIHNT